MDVQADVRYDWFLLGHKVKTKNMSVPQVLYEAELAKAGRKLTCGGMAALALWTGVGVVLCFKFTPFPGSLILLLFFALGAVGLSIQALRLMRLCRNAGYYRISMDDYGLYVQSDDPSLAPSFSVIAPDVCRLVRKAIKQYDSTDNYEYYVETKSGTRHRIEQLFADYDLDVMGMFERIAERFPWVEIVEEVVPRRL